MFLGEYQHNLDGKGRVSVPAKYRSELGSSAIVTKGLDACLYLYPKGEWEKMAEKISSLPISSSSARTFARVMLAGAMEVELDKQGRVLLPAYLRDYANIDGDAVMAGVYNRVEIWNKEAWKSNTKIEEGSISETVEQLKEWEI